MSDAERLADWLLEADPAAVVHWYHSPALTLCDDYVLGDAVIDHDRTAVTCTECLEWMHA